MIIYLNEIYYKLTFFFFFLKKNDRSNINDCNYNLKYSLRDFIIKEMCYIFNLLTTIINV